MDWTNDNVIKFLELYQMHPCIWDPQNSAHKNKAKINDAWHDIKNNMGPLCTIKDLKRKKESLMSAYRGYRTKIKKSKTSGTANLYQPTWFAYDFMSSFLGPIYKCKPSMKNRNNQQFKNLNFSQDDTENTNSGGETDSSNREEEHPLCATQGVYMNQDVNHTVPTTSFKRQLVNPPELQQVKNQMDQAYNILKNVAQLKHNDEEDDECSDFGKLVAKKLSKLSEDRRDLLMIKINQMIYDERQEHMRKNSASKLVIKQNID